MAQAGKTDKQGRQEMRAVPTINTARVTLRAMRPEDFDRFADIWADPEVVHFVGGQPKTRSEAWRSFLTNVGHWQITGFGQWAIETHRTKRVVGQAGFFYGARELGEDFDHWPEAGWVLSRDAQGVGLGAEATRAAHDWFDRVITGPLVCMIDPEHERSRKLAEILGYKFLREADNGGGMVQLFMRKGPPGER